MAPSNFLISSIGGPGHITSSILAVDTHTTHARPTHCHVGLRASGPACQPPNPRYPHTPPKALSPCSPDSRLALASSTAPAGPGPTHVPRPPRATRGWARGAQPPHRCRVHGASRGPTWRAHGASGGVDLAGPTVVSGAHTPSQAVARALLLPCWPRSRLFFFCPAVFAHRTLWFCGICFYFVIIVDRFQMVVGQRFHPLPCRHAGAGEHTVLMDQDQKSRFDSLIWTLYIFSF